MKKILLFLFLFPGIYSYAQNQQETVDWLNRNFEEYYASGWGEKYTIKIVHDKNYGEFIAVDVLYQPLKTKSFFSFQPDAIKAIKTTRKLRSDKINGPLDIELLAYKGRIYTDEKDFIDSKIISLQAPDDKIEQIIKGLKHLISLMGHEVEEEKEFFTN